MSYKFKRCDNCIFQDDCNSGYAGFSPYECCENEMCYWKPQEWIKEWLNSFDISSATKCFEAVNKLKEAIEDE